MKRKKYIFLFVGFSILCFLCSCGNADSANKVPQINCEYGYSNFAVSGEDGYYFLCKGRISYWDGNIDHKAVPLCKRPDCKHNSNECYSCIMGAQYKMFYVDGYLYVFDLFASQDPVTKSQAFPLWKVAADGTSKEKVLYASEQPADYTIFKDKVYYELRTPNAEGKTVGRILCQPLEGGEETLVWESSLQNGIISTLQGIGDELYFYEDGIAMSIDMNAPDFDIDEAEVEYNLYVYEPETKELIKNPDFQGKDGSKIKIRNIYDGKVYYSYWDNKKNEMWCKPVEGDGEEECLGSMPPYVNIMDSEYAYAYWRRDAEKGISYVKAYDHEGNLLQEIRMPHMDDMLEWIPATEEYIFAYYLGPISEDGSHQDIAIVLLERSKLAEGKAELIWLFQD